MNSVWFSHRSSVFRCAHSAMMCLTYLWALRIECDDFLPKKCTFIGDLDYSAKARREVWKRIRMRSRLGRLAGKFRRHAAFAQLDGNRKWFSHELADICQVFFVRKCFKVLIKSSKLLLTSLLFLALEKHRFTIQTRSIRASTTVFLEKNEQFRILCGVKWFRYARIFPAK